MERLVILLFILTTFKAVPQEQPFAFYGPLTCIDSGRDEQTYALHLLLTDTSTQYLMEVTDQGNAYSIKIYKKSVTATRLLIQKDSVLFLPVIYEFSEKESLEIELVTTTFNNGYICKTHGFYALTDGGRLIFSYTDKYLLNREQASDNQLLEVSHRLKFKDLDKDSRLDLRLKTIRAYSKERNCACDARERFEVSKKDFFF